MNRIAELRAKKKISRKDLCEATGISEKTMREYEMCGDMTETDIRNLSKFFKVSADYLLMMNNHTSVTVTDANEKVLAVITNEEIIEHDGYRVILAEE